MGHRRVVDLDLEKFFDRVNHEKLLALVAERVPDGRVRKLIREYLKAGMASGAVYIPRDEGTPQGGPLSPLLANLLLDHRDVVRQFLELQPALQDVLQILGELHRGDCLTLVGVRLDELDDLQEDAELRHRQQK